MEQKKLALFFYGMPGSGKGTQIEFLKKKFKNLYSYTMSDGIREVRNNKNEDEKLKERIKEIDKGCLLSNEDLFEIFKKTFKGLNKNILLLDGLIRKKEQADFFLDFFKREGFELKFLFINITSEESIKRILKRGKTSNREDDMTEERIKIRIRLYKENHQSIIEKVDKKYIIEINGLQTREEVFEEVLKKINLK